MITLPLHLKELISPFIAPVLPSLARKYSHRLEIFMVSSHPDTSQLGLSLALELLPKG